MSGGASRGETSKVKHSEVSSKAEESNKGESVGGFVSGVQEGTRGTKEKADGSHAFKVSFRDKVVGGETYKPFVIDDDLDGEKLATVTCRNVDFSRSKVQFSDEGLQVLAKSYIDSIVIKVLGKESELYRSYSSIQTCLATPWWV
ncbi:hypothetical protein PIB30_094474 [Stylosanthes scabra]|uniref:Uncharacterized protein n=1 Tax=Stylosanthes scabra TaxID=79078 RepID=A0ABU6ZU57_9FABA|nr:hypothetical protein [Stylosanthes scabra]